MKIGGVSNTIWWRSQNEKGVGGNKPIQTQDGRITLIEEVKIMSLLSRMLNKRVKNKLTKKKEVMD